MKEKLSSNRTFLMGLAMLAVVCFHHGWTVIPGFTAIFSRFGLWGVDIFLFLSGFGCVYALNKYTTDIFWKKRLIRLLPTCLVAGTLIYCTDFYFHAERTMTYAPVRLVSLHRWYIQAILICYILCPLAYKVMKNYRFNGLILIVALSILIELLLPEISVWKINWAFGRLPVFFTGMYVSMYNPDMNRRYCVISVCCLLIAMVIRCGGGYYIFQWTYFLAVAMPFVCDVLCRLSTGLKQLRVYRALEVLGKYSLEIYLIHEYTYWVLQESTLPLLYKYPVFLVVVTSLCFILKIITRRINIPAVT